MMLSWRVSAMLGVVGNIVPSMRGDGVEGKYGRGEEEEGGGVGWGGGGTVGGEETSG
jgi:hypothetical protein